ncbi:hypothetical protein CDD83_8673 [Cordyceps sp. RAO-2017]|nr:hypothetical protein CDD83_8673 [Cordyceps sp. RAO-2017]
MTATHSTLSSRRDASFEGPGPSVAYRPPQPSSPTLTNPDMILPDYDYAAGPLNHCSRSPPSKWNMARNAPDTDFHPLPQPVFHAMPLGPTTPIIYGNGTMLSDIGEVTEVESTTGSPPRHLSSRYSTVGSDGTPLRSSPTVGNGLFKKRLAAAHGAAQERRRSIESTSTIHDAERNGAPLDDFDDSVSVDDSNFQGDDEESTASSYVDDLPPIESESESKPSAVISNPNRFSTSSISKRAEQILANAKRRLNTMEGNLSRARNFGYSSASDGSTPSPGARPVASLDEGMLLTSSTHSRNASEIGPQTPLRPMSDVQRSASALGAAGGYRQLPISRSVDALGGRHPHLSTKLSHHPLDITLEPLSEDDDDDDGDRIIDDEYQGSRASSVVSPTSSAYSDAGISRSTSSAQVRDLHDQMQGLKGKISSLREQARADSMKRRSLQGLRTPSPFTHARWDPAHVEPPSMTTPDLAGAELEGGLDGTATEPEAQGGLGLSEDGTPRALSEVDSRPGIGHHTTRESHEKDGHDGLEAFKTGRGPDAHGGQRNGAPHERVEELADEDDGEGEFELEGEFEVDGAGEGAEGEESDESDEAEGEVDNWSESGDSLYHDTYQHPISHEDREDAFDYERFFLHSAMGTLSRQGFSRRGSSSSEGSGDSVETTRGPVLSRARRPSLDTFTTVESFATAVEGRASQISMVEEDGADNEAVLQGREDEEFEASDPSTSGRFSSGNGSSYGSSGDENGQLQRSRPRQGSVLHRPTGTTTAWTLHRPSCSSFESTGTNRSFPLVNRARMSGGMLTPMGSPEHELTQVSESLMSETASICDKESMEGGAPSPAMQMLSKDDQTMVERVVASLGRCVLGLTEATRTNAAGEEEFRRRIEAARKILEAGT